MKYEVLYNGPCLDWELTCGHIVSITYFQFNFSFL